MLSKSLTNFMTSKIAQIPSESFQYHHSSSSSSQHRPVLRSHGASNGSLTFRPSGALKWPCGESPFPTFVLTWSSCSGRVVRQLEYRGEFQGRWISVFVGMPYNRVKVSKNLAVELAAWCSVHSSHACFMLMYLEIKIKQLPNMMKVIVWRFESSQTQDGWFFRCSQKIDLSSCLSFSLPVIWAEQCIPAAG